MIDIRTRRQAAVVRRVTREERVYSGGHAYRWTGDHVAVQGCRGTSVQGGGGRGAETRHAQIEPTPHRHRRYTVYISSLLRAQILTVKIGKVVYPLCYSFVFYCVISRGIVGFFGLRRNGLRPSRNSFAL